jgi:Holliday junction resolvase RusA-like endonuclease
VTSPPLEWLWFSVNGDPRPQGSKRGFVTKTGRVAMVDMSKGLKEWRNEIALHAVVAAKNFGWELTTEPIDILLRFVMREPQKPKYPYPATRPDVDKLIRAAFDGITDSKRIWKDDSQAVHVRAVKTYGKPGMSVLLWKTR